MKRRPVLALTCIFGMAWLSSLVAQTPGAKAQALRLTAAHDEAERWAEETLKTLPLERQVAKPLTPIVRRVYQMGIPVIVIDRAIDGDTYTVFVGAPVQDTGRRSDPGQRSSPAVSVFRAGPLPGNGN
jgi:hypothetical protein